MLSHTLIFLFLMHLAWPPAAAPERVVTSAAPSCGLAAFCRILGHTKMAQGISESSPEAAKELIVQTGIKT